MKSCERRIERRTGGEKDCGDEQKNQKIRHDKPHDLVRDKLEKNSILRGQRPRRKLEKLEVACQRSHLAMELTSEFLRPCIVNTSLRIDNRPVALADDRQRLKHVVQDHSGRLRHNQLTANCVEAPIDSNRRVEESLAVPDPLFVAPVEPADCRSKRRRVRPDAE